MSMVTVFEALLYFHAVVLMSTEVGRKKVIIGRNTVNSTMADRLFSLCEGLGKCLSSLSRLDDYGLWYISIWGSIQRLLSLRYYSRDQRVSCHWN